MNCTFQFSIFRNGILVVTYLEYTYYRQEFNAIFNGHLSTDYYQNFTKSLLLNFNQLLWSIVWQPGLYKQYKLHIYLIKLVEIF